MTRWIWDNCEEHERTITYQSHVQAMMSIGTVLANAAAAAQCLVDLAEHGEEMVPLLRGEFERVVGGGDGISKQALSSLSMMDSFVKESQRVRPPGAGESSLSNLFQTCNFLSLPSDNVGMNDSHLRTQSPGTFYSPRRYATQGR